MIGGRPDRASLGAGKTGLFLALGLGLVFAGIILWFISRGGPSTPNNSSEVVPSITEMPRPGDVGTITGASEAKLILLNRDDPSKVAWIVHVDAFNPIAGGKVSAVSPRAWIYLNAGRVLHVRAEEAVFDRALENQEPEAGVFRGGVEIRVFEGAGESQPRPETDRADALIKTESLRFDSVRGELSTEDDVSVESDQLDAQLRGFRAQFDEIDNRIERIDVPRGGEVVYRPQASGAPDTTRSHVRRHAPRIRTVSGTREEPRIHHYDAEFTQDVVLIQGERRIDSDTLRVFLRTINGGVPDDAVRDFSPGITRLPSLPETVAHAAVGRVAPAGEGTGSGTEPPVRLRWAGPMRMKFVPDAPPELDADHIALRFESLNDARVRFEDPESGASGNADSLFYGMTSRTVSLAGSAESPAAVEAPGAGRYTGISLTANLTSGVGSGEGPGVLRDEARARSIEWGGEVRFQLQTRGGVAIGAVRSAEFLGGVRLSDQRSDVEGGSLVATFSDAPEGGADGLSNLDAVRVRDNVVARTRGGRMSADEIDVLFEHGASEPDPNLMVARGGVTATQGETRIECDSIEASLTRNVDGDVDVVEALLSGNATFMRGEDTVAKGDEIRAHNLRKTTSLVGAPASVRQGPTTIIGEHLTLAESDGSVLAEGAGSFQHTGAGGSAATAVWTESMKFVDSAGTLDAAGGVEVKLINRDGRHDTFRGESLHATFVANETDRSEGEAAVPGGEAIELSGERDLRTVLAIGTEEAPASIESTRFEPGRTDPIQALLLSGKTIRADNEAGTLRVPGAGRLLLSDLREQLEDSESARLTRGAALFDWQGSLRLNRERGSIILRDAVRMVHRPVAKNAQGLDLLDQEGQVTELDCERLTAMLSDLEGGDASSPRLESVLCEGAVWARAGSRELLADRVEFDAELDSARAESTTGGWVTVFDSDQATPITAGSINWNTRTGRVEILQPRPIVAPARER